jgi:hypothetical protein
MVMKSLTAAGAAAMLAGAVVFTAYPSSAPRAQNSDGRYLVTQIEGGIMRVDRETGEVSVCKGGEGGWRCELVPDDRVAVQREMDRLARENQRLRRGGQARPGMQERQRAETRRQRERRNSFDNLGEDGVITPDEVDRTMDAVERMMQRFMETARRLQRDYEQDPPDGTRRPR